MMDVALQGEAAPYATVLRGAVGSYRVVRARVEE